MKRALLTGGSGFVGANLARRLIQEGHELHLLLRPGYRPWRIEGIRSQVRLHETELSDRKALDRLARKIRPDWVFHLAAYGSYSTQCDIDEMVRSNIQGTIHLVEACANSGFEAFVNTGSSSEYGYKDHPPSERDLLEPNSPYAVTKASGTLFCCHTAASRSLPIRTLRLYSVYGPYEEPTRLMPTLIKHGLEGRLPPLVNPEVARDFVYVEDVSEAYILAAALHETKDVGAIYNVGTGVQTSVRQVVEIARQVLPIQAEPTWGSMPDRAWDTNVWVADNRAIRERLGWAPRFSFEQGFRRMVNWCRENPRECEPPRN